MGQIDLDKNSTFLILKLSGVMFEIFFKVSDIVNKYPSTHKVTSVNDPTIRQVMGLEVFFYEMDKIDLIKSIFYKFNFLTIFSTIPQRLNLEGLYLRSNLNFKFIKMYNGQTANNFVTNLIKTCTMTGNHSKFFGDIYSKSLRLFFSIKCDIDVVINSIEKYKIFDERSELLYLMKLKNYNVVLNDLEMSIDYK
jgi:hypothetical protein